MFIRAVFSDQIYTVKPGLLRKPDAQLQAHQRNYANASTCVSKYSISSKGFPSKPKSMSPYEDISAHILLRLVPSLTPIGTVRVFKSPRGDYYKLTRLAVLKDYRRYRFGRLLIETLHEWVKAHALETSNAGGTVNIVCHSQILVQGFYAKFGYTPEGQPFDEEGDPHQKMVLRLPL